MKIRSLLAVVAGFVLSAATSQATITLGFASLPDQFIQFSGSTFSLTPQSGSVATPQFFINADTGGNGSALGLNGWINGSPWTIGAITTVAPGVETAPVTSGNGTLNIWDGSVALTGDIQWISLSSAFASGNVNQNATVNISNLAYSGGNSDLQQLIAGGTNGIITLSYTWTSPTSLSQLVAGPTIVDNYTGNLTTVPEPSTVVAGALLLLPFGAGAFRSLRKKS